MNRFAKILSIAIAVPTLALSATAYADLSPPEHTRMQPREHRGETRPMLQTGEETHGEHAATGETGAEHGAGEHGEHHGPAPINWTDFSNKEQPPYAAALLNFAILIGVGYVFGKKPIAEALKARRASVAKEMEEAAKMKAAAEERAKKYQASLEHLEDDLAATKASLIDAGRAEKARIVADAEEKAVRMRRDAEFRVEQETKQLKLDLTRETVEGAVSEAESLLATKITPEDHTRLANEFLAELSKKPMLEGAA